jgi:hypothetical protein
MDFVINLFWNREERRLRALWRLGLQTLLWFVLLFLFQAAAGIVIGVVAIATQTVTIEQLSDVTTLEDMLLHRPGALLVITLVSLAAYLISVWVAGRFLDRRRFKTFGFRFSKSWWIGFGFGLALGALSMAIIFIVELALGWVTVTGTLVTRRPGDVFALALLMPLGTFIAVGIYEELFSRGYHIKNLAEGLNWRRIGPRRAVAIATLISSVVFGLLHANNPNATTFSTVNLMLAGAQLALGYVLTGELAIPIGLHIAWNFFEGNVFGFPVSGGDYRAATFIGIEQGGPDLWTGGAFGPEGGLLGILVMLLGCALIALWVRWRTGRVGVHGALAEYEPRRVASAEMKVES